RPPSFKVNKTNETIAASSLRRMSSSHASWMTLPPASMRRRAVIIRRSVRQLYGSCPLHRQLRTWARRSSRGLLPQNLALFSGLPQLPIPLGMDLRLTPGEHVLRRDVADGNQYENGGFTSSAGDDPGGPFLMVASKNSLNRVPFMLACRQKYSMNR